MWCWRSLPSAMAPTCSSRSRSSTSAGSSAGSSVEVVGDGAIVEAGCCVLEPRIADGDARASILHEAFVALLRNRPILAAELAQRGRSQRDGGADGGRQVRVSKRLREDSPGPSGAQRGRPAMLAAGAGPCTGGGAAVGAGRKGGAATGRQKHHDRRMRSPRLMLGGLRPARRGRTSRRTRDRSTRHGPGSRWPRAPRRPRARA